MIDTAKRIADLSPDKRQLLLERLTRKTGPGAQAADPAAAAAAAPPADLRRDENFSVEVAQPGILDSFRFKRVPRRPPGPGEVEIGVRAGSLNFRDVMIALGMYPTLPGHPAEMGSDCSGTIVAVGEGVEGFREGDEVVALANGFTAYTTTTAAAVAHKPARLSHEDGAAIPTVFLTTYYGLLHLAQLSKGERILIHSAAGGVGLTAIQIARLAGAEVIATVGTDEKRAYLRTLGVEHILNSRSLDFADGVMKLTDGKGVDVVLNSLAGEAIPKGLGVLRPLGRFVELGKRDIYQNVPLGLQPFRKALSFHAVELGLVLRERPAVFRAMFREVLGHFAAGAFTPLPARIFPIADMKDAAEHMSQGTHIGKIVVRVKES
jgi:NADPH:quinone reductase-like Zn-dependent oxidoreductase